eukprot:jgi/Hompol1/4052/HPOL_006905-RA
MMRMPEKSTSRQLLQRLGRLFLTVADEASNAQYEKRSSPFFATPHRRAAVRVAAIAIASGPGPAPAPAVSSSAASASSSSSGSSSVAQLDQLDESELERLESLGLMDTDTFTWSDHITDSSGLFSGSIRVSQSTIDDLRKSSSAPADNMYTWTRLRLLAFLPQKR